MQYVMNLSLSLFLDKIQSTVMNDDVLSSVSACKKQHRQSLIRRKVKRRALLAKRRLLLDPIHSHRPIQSASITFKKEDDHLASLLDDESPSDAFDVTSSDRQKLDESTYTSQNRSADPNVSCEDDGTRRFDSNLNQIVEMNLVVI